MLDHSKFCGFYLYPTKFLLNFSSNILEPSGSVPWNSSLGSDVTEDTKDTGKARATEHQCRQKEELEWKNENIPQTSKIIMQICG